MSAIEQRHIAALSGFEDRLKGIGPGIELPAITPAKLLPSLDPMSEPLSKVRARGHVLQPCISIEGFLLHPSRPEALDQNPSAIAARGTLVRTLDSNHSACLRA